MRGIKHRALLVKSTNLWQKKQNRLQLADSSGRRLNYVALSWEILRQCECEAELCWKRSIPQLLFAPINKTLKLPDWSVYKKTPRHLQEQESVFFRREMMSCFGTKPLWNTDWPDGRHNTIHTLAQNKRLSSDKNRILLDERVREREREKRGSVKSCAVWFEKRAKATETSNARGGSRWGED